jgi:hypothetical protein
MQHIYTRRIVLAASAALVLFAALFAWIRVAA